MTKLITAAAVLQQTDAGRIQLDDPVEKFLPEFADKQVADDPRYVQDDPDDIQQIIEWNSDRIFCSRQLRYPWADRGGCLRMPV